MHAPAIRRRQALFLTLDRNHTGALDWEDFAHVAEAIRDARGWGSDHVMHQGLIHAMREFWEELAARIDSDKNGRISAAEWMNFHGAMAEEVRDLGRVPLWGLGLLQGIHTVLDLDGDGTISVDEYALWLRAIGSTHDAGAAFAALDEDGDGLLGFDELERLYRSWLLEAEGAAPTADLFTGEPA
jgi:Ca2+-binding EF-hand superfamily protein